MSEMATDGTGTYIYGITYAESLGNGNRPLEVSGIGEGGSQVRTIVHGDLAAVVSDSPLSQYDVTQENLAAHQRVLDEVMDRSDVLPVSFGIVATNDKEVRENLLERHSDDLHRSLDYVRGKAELTLQILWNQDQVFREIVEEDPEIQQLRDAVTAQPANAAQDDRVRLGELTAAALQRKTEQEALIAYLQGLGLAVKSNQ